MNAAYFLSSIIIIRERSKINSQKKSKNHYYIVCKAQMLPTFFLHTFLFCASLLCSSAKEIITLNSSIIDGEGESLISPGKKFELGFFTPNGSSNTRRYVGIWYFGSNQQTVVWVANRDKPLLDDSGVLVVSEDGNLKVLDGSGKSLWSTNLQAVSSGYIKAKLTDAGNLVLSNKEKESSSVSIIWQSFENPTDTFLPGMKMDGDMILTSWKSYDDPAPGNFTFQIDQERVNQFIIWKRTTRYWKSGVSGRFIGPDGMPSAMPSAISFFLSNFTSVVLHNESMPHLTSSLYSDTRLIISFSGQIQYFKWDSEKIWALIWAEPRDKCSVYNACGNFGSCNSNNDLTCKCLPGFAPSSPENWNSQDYFDGCTRKSRICDKNAASDTFLSLKMMEVGNPDSQYNAKSEVECKLECLNNCQCQAYSYEELDLERQSESSIAACWIWLEDLNNIQEEYEGGRNLNVRLAVSDVESTRRSCETCGTNLIPYPLSTGPKCGDAMYLSFHCSVSSGEVTFYALSGTFRVTSINSETRKFIIQTNDANDCKAGNSGDSSFQFKQPSPFHVTSRCNADEVEVGWDPPLEPTCSSLADCKDWPNSSCNVTSDGKKRCLCNESFRWDNLSLNCTEDRAYRKKRYKSSARKIALSLILVLAFLSGVVLIILSSTIVYVYLQRRKLAEGEGIWGNIHRNSALHLYDSERHVKDLIDSGRFKEDDTDGIEVPFFQLESILAATNYFSNANKLGQGGFGAVYKGKFPEGREIAVKRLSSGSGQGLEEFKNEVVLIARLQHRNLVRLLGYCVAGDEKMLLYEYMPNKSLDSFIFDRKLSILLDWDMRYRIISGIARGLLYLHQDSRLRIIHRDLKTSNILLDEEMNPKISDFGLARIFGGKETAANTNRVVGTYGYMSPEYALDGLFSFKSDVFSFGVVVIEIITGKRNTGFYQPEQSLSLLGYAWHLWKADKAFDLLDQTLRGSCNANELLKCLTVALLCVQEDPSDRPTMSQVVFMLGSEIASLPAPKQPAFVVRRCPSSRASSSSKPETFSHNELTVTLEHGR
ncbi:G-type lectin S-receptor-like serine/threonine-protein kinase At4g03230 isoform X1 [Herrania umbratica]|uniref:non-specific serine/threonine protein kinase n=1 Tax=Herrania umbratica TaxID=108875 RepID=A0A6J0ZZS0_9ROSI|nr:G-type lectin S-receptor-like serine/threonine-protein kinase At4g03230 isoform X1 [Herrania umbratica]